MATSPTATSTLRQRKRAAAKAHVAATALSLFAARGYADVSVAEICEAANVAQRSFFRYFPTKEDVLLEPVRESSERVERAIIAAPAGLTDAEVLERALRESGEYLLSNWEQMNAYFRIVQETSAVRASPYLQLADRERAMAELLLRRRDEAGRPDWRLRLLVAHRIAAYRVWMEEVRTSEIADPLGHLDRIFAAC